ncbi:uridine kinase [Dactylosporangium siamense]|uniref:uridine kinase n=1 Tax=Dactylosporangium siamense TaxID=685454 RepID=UPI0019439C8D|nr:uridine kinase [Dactylosporangium siamense]
MKARPVTVGGLAADIAARVGKVHATRVAVDGAPTAGGDVLAARVVEQVHADGGHAVHIPAGGFLRQASLRLERGRTNPDAYYEDWLDLRAITREVLRPAATGGTGRVLPSLRDPVTDRATRAAYLDLPAGAVVVVSGTMLLGAGLDFDVTVHLTQSPAALARRTPAEMQWTLPAFQRYDNEVLPQDIADVVVRADDPRHPAVVL